MIHRYNKIQKHIARWRPPEKLYGSSEYWSSWDFATMPLSERQLATASTALRISTQTRCYSYSCRTPGINNVTAWLHDPKPQSQAQVYPAFMRWGFTCFLWVFMVHGICLPISRRIALTFILLKYHARRYSNCHPYNVIYHNKKQTVYLIGSQNLLNWYSECLLKSYVKSVSQNITDD